MSNENSVNDIFRFMQLRPMRPPQETPSVALIAETPLAKRLLATPASRRSSLADAALKSGVGLVRASTDVPLGPEIEAAIRELAPAEAATTDLLARLPDLQSIIGSQAFESAGIALSDTLLASYFATQGQPASLAVLQNLHRVYHLLRLLRAGATLPDQTLASLLAARLLTPAFPRATPSPGRSRERASEASPQPANRTATANAIAELARLDRPEHLVAPDENGLRSERGVPFTLAETARRNLSPATLATLAEHRIDLNTTAIDTAVHVLTTAHPDLDLAVIDWPQPQVTVDPGPTLPPPPTLALVRPAGIADLLVVKQQIKRYEAGEIAHVENVLIGEKKSRAHRQLDRREETFASDQETTREHQTELETADRFELNRETSQTIEEDLKVGAGLSLSGKYGPSVEFSSNFQMDVSTSSEETAKSSSRFARDVVNRSLDRVTERVREQRSRTTISETEETNLHELDNKTSQHVRGVYQFIDKVYEAQIFNYGIREMFDFMVPEPASFLWHIAQHPQLDLKLPPPPPKLELVAPDARYITEDNALALAGTYGATDVEAAPPLYKRLTVGFKHGTDNASESDQPHSNDRVELQLPAGYRPLRARIRGLAFTDEHPVIGVVIGRHRALWKPTDADRTDLSDDHELAHQPELFLDLSGEPYETSDAKLAVSYLAWETATYTIDIVIVVQRTPEELMRWRVATYKKIRAAYEERVRVHEQKVEELTAAAEARAERESRLPYGAPPAENARTVRAELKKHCLSIITEQRFDAFDATREGTPPYFDLVEAAAEGSYIRFFEQAFEWDQLQYVCYPYFWARKTTWIDRFVKQDVDPQFLEFLKAGAARVVVPVRPGFEVAVTHFLETGKLWNGEGEPPEINSPLYVSIVDEIRERTGAPQGEAAVGEPWDVRVPTALVAIRTEGDLPQWERTAPGVWSWRPATAP